MKNLKFFFGLLLLTIGLLFFIGCNQEENATPMDDALIEERATTTPYYPNIIFYALGTNNELYKYRSGPPAYQLSSVILKGLRDDEFMVGIDFRPLNKKLYGVSNLNYIYMINLNLEPGAAYAIVTQISQTPFSPGIEGECVGFDFNPMTDRISLVTDKGQNLRIHPVTGQVAGTDIILNGPAAAVNSVAYSNNYVGAFGSTLYDIDILGGKMFRQNPTTGSLTLIGSTGLTIYGDGGFDIARTGTAMAVLLAAANPGYATPDFDTDRAYRLYGMNLRTGKATSLGKIQPVIGMAIPL